MRSFLTKKGKISPVYESEDLWITFEQMSQVLAVPQRTAKRYLSELERLSRITEPTTCRLFTLTRQEGGRTVNRPIKHYNTRAVMLVAFRSNSEQALDFQEWAIDVLIELKQKGVVYATPQLPDHNHDLTELKAKVLQLQGIINECQMDMNEGLVPWFGGQLPKRVTYLIGSQKGVRPKATQLPPVLPLPLSDKLLRIMRQYHDRNDKWPTLNEIRVKTGRSSATRQSKEVVGEELQRLEVLGKVQRDESGRSTRYRII